MDSEKLSEDEMKQIMINKATNWGYTDLRPLTEDETKTVNESLKQLKEIEKKTALSPEFSCTLCRSLAHS